MIEPRRLLKSITRVSPPGEARIGTVCRFDRNEKTTPFPEKHLKKIIADIHPDEMIAYPELEPFCQKLADWLGMKRSEVIIAAGSDTVIKSVYEVYVEEGDEVVILSPTYGMYNVYGRMFGAVTKEVFYDNDLSLPVKRILDAINEKTKIVALANPNHTGTVIAEKDLISVIKAAAKVNALVVLDEAYHHFYTGTMLPFLRQFDNLLLIRTFSKAFGVAPCRIGYGVSHPTIIEHLNKVRLTHEITAFSARVGTYLLDHLDIMTDYVKDVAEAKEVLYKRMPKMDCEVLKSEANFVYFKTPSGIDAKKVMAELEKRKIFIKGPFDKSPFSGHLRVTVGTAKQMNMFCDEIGKIIKE